jgi:hypothetical protein
MKVGLLVPILFTLAFPANSQASDGHLEGCSDPTTLASSLAKLRQSHWQDMTVARVQAIWPIELRGVSCDTLSCSSVESKGRIINGHYECSEAFQFDVKRDGDKVVERLNNIIIHYSTSDQKGTTETVKTLAKAAGLTESDLRLISGAEPEQDFHWDSAKGEVSTLVVMFSRNGSVWTGSLNFSRFAK